MAALVYQLGLKNLGSLSLSLSLSLSVPVSPCRMCVIPQCGDIAFYFNQQSKPNCARRLVAKLNYHGRIGSEKPGRAALTTCDEC